MDARLREGIRLFNARSYFESHQRLEDFYVEAADQHKPFVEGLIQLATALRLFTEFDEVKGPARMARQALVRLENYQPNYLGVKVTKLIRSMDAWARSIEGLAGTTPERALAPKISIRRLFFF